MISSTHSLTVPQKHLLKNKLFKVRWVDATHVCIAWSFDEIWDGACKNCRAENHKTVKKITQERRKRTNLLNYGVENVMQSSSIKDKNKASCMEHLGVENPSQAEPVKTKKRQTCLKNYGVDSPSKSKEIMNKIQRTNRRLYGYDWGLQSETIKEKSRVTCKERYGVEYASQADCFKDNLKTSLKKKYGVSCVLNCPKIRRKAISSLFKNGNRSGLERYFLECLEKMGAVEHVDFEQEYYDKDRYPFYCDFYFPKTDTFLEINGFWTHGGHWFNENNKTDIEKLDKWKAKNTKFYDNAIKTWTERDVGKRNTAFKNDLNYIVLWSRKEVEQFCQNNLKNLV